MLFRSDDSDAHPCLIIRVFLFREELRRAPAGAIFVLHAPPVIRFHKNSYGCALRDFRNHFGGLARRFAHVQAAGCRRHDR